MPRLPPGAVRRIRGFIPRSAFSLALAFIRGAIDTVLGLPGAIQRIGEVITAGQEEEKKLVGDPNGCECAASITGPNAAIERVI